MDCNTGSIYPIDEEKNLNILEEMVGRKLAPLTEEQAQSLHPKPRGVRKRWMKHQPCPCGSGKKFYKCHWHEYV